MAAWIQKKIQKIGIHWVAAFLLYKCVSKTNCQQNNFAWLMFKALVYLFHKKKHQEKWTFLSNSYTLLMSHIRT